MKRRKRIVVLTLLVAIAFCLFPKSEETFEFDGVNLRLRECSRSRSRLLGFVFWEHCSQPWDHPTAVRLRELGMIPPVREEDSRWLLIKGFTTGVRGWMGAGREYVRGIGAASFGTPVTLPAQEEVSENTWVRWAVKDPEGSKQFWQSFLDLARQNLHGGYYNAYFLRAAKDYLEERKLEITVPELQAHARQFVE